MVGFLKFLLFLVLMTFSFSLGVRFSDTFKGKFGNTESIEIQAESTIDDITKDSEEKIEEIKEELEEEQEQNIEENIEENIEQNIENKVENTEKTITNDFEEPISMDGVEEGIYQEENIKTIQNDMIDNTDIIETNTQNIENQSQNFDNTNNQVHEINQ